MEQNPCIRLILMPMKQRERQRNIRGPMFKQQQMNPKKKNNFLINHDDSGGNSKDFFILQFTDQTRKVQGYQKQERPMSIYDSACPETEIDIKTRPPHTKTKQKNRETED